MYLERVDGDCTLEAVPEQSMSSGSQWEHRTVVLPDYQGTGVGSTIAMDVRGLPVSSQLASN